jgi:cytoskeletal protein CcmA (bactofilin family)
MEIQSQPRSVSAKEEITSIGKCVVIKGELTGEEDLIIEGRVEGKIVLKDHQLVIGPHGAINGEIRAKNIAVIGEVVGNIFVGDLVEIRARGSVVGDIESSRISVADGAHFKGSVDLRKCEGQVEGGPSPNPEPAKMNLRQPVLGRSPGDIGLKDVKRTSLPVRVATA